MTITTGNKERSQTKNDLCKEINPLSILSPKDAQYLSQSNSCNGAIHSHPPKKRRFVSGIVYLLFTSSFIYLVAGPWIGWDGSVVQQTLLTVCSSAVIVRWPLRKSILKLAPHRRAQKWQIILYCLIPWRMLSRSWGGIAAVRIPGPARTLVYGVYCKLFGVDMEEIEKPLFQYKTISDFFTRRLKSGVRSIETCGLLVAPCDGTVVHCGPISDKYIKKVKGLDYCVETFLGLKPNLRSIIYTQNRKTLPYKTCMYQCVIYLAPGDYHRFHSSCDWVALQRLHFCGQLLSVAPKIAKWLPNLLAINERVVYVGEWEHGFFSYTAVGATNVGSIIVHNDPTLKTNKYSPRSKVDYVQFSSNYFLSRGEEMGLFSMGSTIVLIFEAPENFHFTCRENDRIKLGSCLGGLDFLSSLSHVSLNSIDSEDTSDVDGNDYDLDYEFGGSEKLFVS